MRIRSDAELHRIRGELLVGGADHARREAPACFVAAQAIARNQKARSLELRCAMCLCRYHRSTGKQADARRQLAETCNWFSEGLQTRDLVDARALLEELR